MTTGTDGSRTKTADATKVAQDVVSRYADESAATGRTYYGIWKAAADATMRAAIELQNASLQVSRLMWDASVQANRSWLDQATESSLAAARTGLDLQKVSLQSSRSWIDSAIQTNNSYLDQATDFVRQSQAAAVKYADVSMDVAESAWPAARR